MLILCCDLRSEPGTDAKVDGMLASTRRRAV
jgi:hypothetical protein